MDRYRDYSSSTIGELIGQMAVEMEKKSDECQSLRVELTKKNSQLDQMSKRVDALEEECRSFRRDLSCAQEERAKIAEILGLRGTSDSDARVPQETSSSYVQVPVPHSEVARPAVETDLMEYAKATLERMRQLNRTAE